MPHQSRASVLFRETRTSSRLEVRSSSSHNLPLQTRRNHMCVMLRVMPLAAAITSVVLATMPGCDDQVSMSGAMPNDREFSVVTFLFVLAFRL